MIKEADKLMHIKQNRGKMLNRKWKEEEREKGNKDVGRKTRYKKQKGRM